MIALIFGGSGSGKSDYAEKLAVSLSAAQRIYLATMQIYDDESRKRVRRHRRMRADRGFETLECPKNIGDISVYRDSLILLEDLPNLLANEMFDPDGDPDGIFPAIQTLARNCRHMLIVSGDVFRDGAQHEAETNAYLRKLADLNSRIAEISDCAAEIVYSIPVAIKGEKICV